jgi:copper chaperone CopZ
VDKDDHKAVEHQDISVNTEEMSLNLPQTEKKTEKPQGNITLMIDGMMCEHCVRHVKEALESVEGVTDINVSLEENKATVSADPGKIQAMVDAITAEDYEVTDVINAQ